MKQIVQRTLSEEVMDKIMTLFFIRLVIFGFSMVEHSN